MSILSRLNLGIKQFAAKPVKRDAKPKTFIPTESLTERGKAINSKRTHENAYFEKQRTRRKRALERYPALRTYVATLKAETQSTPIIVDGVLDIDIKGLIDDLKLGALPDSAKDVALAITNDFVRDVHTHHYGRDLGDEIPWDIPPGLDYTRTEAKNALWPNGITFNFQDDSDPENAIASWFRKNFK